MRGGLPLLGIQFLQKIFDRKGLRHAMPELPPGDIIPNAAVADKPVAMLTLANTPFVPAKGPRKLAFPTQRPISQLTFAVRDAILKIVFREAVSKPGARRTSTADTRF